MQSFCIKFATHHAWLWDYWYYCIYNEQNCLIYVILLHIDFTSSCSFKQIRICSKLWKPICTCVNSFMTDPSSTQRFVIYWFMWTIFSSQKNNSLHFCYHFYWLSVHYCIDQCSSTFLSTRNPSCTFAFVMEPH